MTQFFRDEKGELSSCRLICFLVTFAAIGIALFAVWQAFKSGKGDIGQGMVALVLGMIGLGITGKVVQKGIE